jgi:cell shape-determining protein MreC
MQSYTIFFIIVNALHVSGGFSAHHQELKNSTHNIWYMSSLLAATASVVDLELVCIQTISNSFTNHFQLNHASRSSKQAWHIPDAVCTVLELLMMGGESAQNM